MYGQVVSEGQAAVFFIEGRRCDLLNPSIGGRWRVSGCSDQAELRLLRRHCRGGAAARCVLRMFLADLVLEHLDPFVAAAHAGAALLCGGVATFELDGLHDAEARRGYAFARDGRSDDA